MKVPVFHAGENFYLGSIITPDGFQYYYGKKLPNNFIALTDLITAKRDVERIKFAEKVLHGTFYSPGKILLYQPFMVAKYDTIEDAKKLANNAVGYPCDTLELLGAKLIKYLSQGTWLYELGGEYYYCSPLGVSITNDPNATFKIYYPACLFKKYPSKFTIKDGKVYYGNELVIPELSYTGFSESNPKYMLSWENMFEVLCDLTKVPVTKP